IIHHLSLHDALPICIGNPALKLPHKHVDVEKIVMTRALEDLSDIQPYLDDSLELDISNTPTPAWLDISDHAGTDLAQASLVDGRSAEHTSALQSRFY